MREAHHSHTHLLGRQPALQAFMYHNFPPPKGPKSVRARTLRAVLNRYVYPPLCGPPITMSDGITEYLAATGKCKRSRPSKKATAEPTIALVWQYIPQMLHTDLVADRMWMDWISHYVVALGANPLRRNQVRTYVTHVLRVLRGDTSTSHAVNTQAVVRRWLVLCP